MEREGDQAGATGAEAARRAAVLRPLVQAYLTASGSLESGIRDAVWKLGVSRATVWRWIRRLAAEGGRTSAMAPFVSGAPCGPSPLPWQSRMSAGILHSHYRASIRRPGSSRLAARLLEGAPLDCSSRPHCVATSAKVRSFRIEGHRADDGEISQLKARNDVQRIVSQI